MQPTFMPWLGYFNLIAKSKVFVFLDDVEYSKGSWHNRNFLFVNNKPLRITIPVVKCSNSTLLNQTEINYDALNIEKLNRLFIQNYNKSKYFYLLEEFSNNLLNRKFLTLSDLNINWIEKITKILGLQNTFIKSSDLDIPACDKVKRISDILNKVKATAYLSPSGAHGYLQDGRFNEIIKQPVKFNHYTCNYSLQKIKQVDKVNLSILSLLMDDNVKVTDKKQIILSGGIID